VSSDGGDRDPDSGAEPRGDADVNGDAEVSGDAEDQADDGARLEPDEEVAPADGLDLARTIARATAGAGTPAKRRTRKRPDRRESGRVSGARPDDRDPQLLDATLGRLVADHGWELSLRVHGVMARWPEIVGDDIAGHSEPESFADGKLVVRATSTAWATELRLLAPTVVRRLNEELGTGTVTVLEVLAPQGPSWKKGSRSIKGARGPRDTYG
jgi:predicted nucleic acid-binding Zn ribbon protein